MLLLQLFVSWEPDAFLIPHIVGCSQWESIKDWQLAIYGTICGRSLTEIRNSDPLNYLTSLCSVENVENIQ